jgi:hypothetical protein
MTVKERELIRRRLAFKALIGEMLKDTSLSYAEIGKSVGRTHQRVAQIRRELGFPRRIGGYHRPPSEIDLLLEQGTKQ